MKTLVDKLLFAYNKDSIFKPDEWTREHTYRAISGGYLKQWVSNIVPVELLKRDLNEAINSIITLCECNEFHTHFPPEIITPNYGDNWGRFANYIEINNRAIAEMNYDKCSNGIISSIKLLPAIPPSAKSWANCIILSQIFPNIYGDGYNKSPVEENSIYGIRLNDGYSRNIINFEIEDIMSPEEQFQVFNDLAHYRGLKTGFRTVISEDQIKIVISGLEETFRWDNPTHVEIFINEHAKLAKLGFEAIFIDSAKHIGNYDMGNYTGVGALPNYQQMQHIINEIRARSCSFTLAFIGEKSTDDFERYKGLGLNAGTGFIPLDDYENVRYWSEKLKYSRDYAPGLEVSNDNTEGGHTYELRLSRLRNCLFGFELASDKLPSFMQMEDLFPLRYDTSTHHLMMSNPSYSIDGSSLSHWENLFTKDDGRYYNHQVGEIFANALFL